MNINSKRLLKEKTMGGSMFFITILSLLLVVVMGVGLYMKSSPIFNELSLLDILTAREWRPAKSQFGFFPFVMGTVWVTLIAIIIAFPISLFTALYLTEYAKSVVRKYVYPALDILAALPSVIYGVWGTLVVVPWISKKLGPVFVDYTSGYTVLAAGIVLGIMILPLLVITQWLKVMIV